MIRLKKSEALRRKIRQDDIEDLGIPSLSLVRQAIQAGRSDEALEFLDYASSVAPPVQDLIIGLVNTFITHIASFGEEEVERAWRQAFVRLQQVGYTLRRVRWSYSKGWLKTIEMVTTVTLKS